MTFNSQKRPLKVVVCVRICYYLRVKAEACSATATISLLLLLLPSLTSTLCCQITCQRRRRWQSGGGGGGEAVEAHLNGYPAYRLPCHVSVRRFLGRSGEGGDHSAASVLRPQSVQKTGPPFGGGEWVENYLSPSGRYTGLAALLLLLSLPFPCFGSEFGPLTMRALVWFGRLGAAANTDCPYLLVCSHCGCPVNLDEIGIVRPCLTV